MKPLWDLLETLEITRQIAPSIPAPGAKLLLPPWPRSPASLKPASRKQVRGREFRGQHLPAFSNCIVQSCLKDSQHFPMFPAIEIDINSGAVSWSTSSCLCSITVISSAVSAEVCFRTSKNRKRRISLQNCSTQLCEVNWAVAQSKVKPCSCIDNGSKTCWFPAGRSSSSCMDIVFTWSIQWPLQESLRKRSKEDLLLGGDHLLQAIIIPALCTWDLVALWGQHLRHKTCQKVHVINIDEYLNIYLKSSEYW